MKPDIQYECMDKKCNTVIIGKGKYTDGISCPRCDGPVQPKPFQLRKKVSEDALYVRSKIVECCQEHCFDLTPEQVETVLNIYKDKLSSLSPVELLQESMRICIGKRNK